MSRIAILSDSVACLGQEQIERYAIRVLPLNFVFEGKVYRDHVDIAPSEAYRFLEKDPEAFLTSPSSPGDYLAVYRELSREADGILCVSLSSKLSTLCNSAQVAKELVSKELPSTRIVVLDTETAAAGEALIVLAAAQAVAEGKSLDEVAGVAEGVKERVRVLVVLETIRHVYRSGRIPKVASQVGSILPLKPILTISSSDSKGFVHFAGATTTKQKGVERIVRMMKKSVGTQSPVHVAVFHANALEEGEKLKQRVSSEFNCVELFLTEFSPVMGYATGQGVVGLSFYPD